MQVLLPILLILTDLCGVVCMTAFVRFVWMYPERSRKCTVITAAAVMVVSISVAVFVSVNIPDIIYLQPADNNLPESVPQEFVQYQLYGEIIQGLINGVLILISPLLILRVKRLFHTFLIELTFYIVVNSTFTFIIAVFDLTKDNLVKYTAETVYSFVLYGLLTILFFLSMKKERQIPLHAVIDTMPRWLFVATIIFFITAYFKTSLFDGLGNNEVLLNIYNALWLISTIGIIIIVGYFLYKLFAMSYQQNQILKQLNDQQVHYERVLQTDEQLREFRHDYKNHMMVVTALLNSGRTAEAADYLEKVKVTSGAYGRQFNTGSFIVDAILNNKNSLAEEFAIHIGFNGRIPPEGIENSDLCTVFSNLLDNAIEGTKRYSGNRYINIESNVRNGMLALSIVNPVNEQVKIKNNRIKTSKSDSRNHGIGLRNVERTAEKYTGHLLLSCDEKEFCADVSLKLNHSEEKEN